MADYRRAPRPLRQVKLVVRIRVRGCILLRFDALRSEDPLLDRQVGKDVVGVESAQFLPLS